MAGRLVLEDFPPAQWAVSRRQHADLARVLSPNGRYCWQTRAKAVRWVQYQVWAALQQQDVAQQPAPARVRLTYVRPTRRQRDQDNWGTGVSKATLDGLVKAGVLEGDDSERLALEPVQFVVEPGRRALVIEIETA
jgi:hypothetical protein